jgi:hypothetical protein
MDYGNEINATNDYSETVRNDAGNATGNATTTATVRIELVVVDGAEGERLHAPQSAVVRRVLARIAEQQHRGGRDTEDRL